MSRFALGGLHRGGLRRRRGDRRGIALLVVISTVMFLTVLVTDISFGARVRFVAAVHERDEARSYWLALTGVNLYRLILTANKAISNNRALAPMLEAYGINAGDAIWQMVPFVNTGLLRMLLTAGSGPVDDEEVEEFERTGEVSEAVREESREGGGSRFGDRAFLDFDGDFSAEVRGEDCRINVNQLATRGSETLLPDTATGQQLYGLLSGEENEAFLRDRNLDRWDLIGNLADWVDADSNVTSGKGGYEDDFYAGLPSPYHAKNAKFDTMAEIHLVEGWTDDVYDRFADQLTIYGGEKININCADDAVILGLFKAYGGSVVNDAELKRLIQDLRTQMALASFKDGAAFLTWVKANATFTPDEKLKDQVGTSTRMFTIVSTGAVGDASVKVTAVMDYSTTVGSVVYWRVD